MLKPPAGNMPGMTDTLEFVKNLWGSMNLPGTNLSSMAAPPMSAEDLDKRIADLKAVESWLNMNLAMLRGTIQTMEVQRATLSTIKSMGASMAEAMRQSGVSAEKMAGMPFGPFFTQPAGAAAQPSPDSAAKSGQEGVGASAQPDTSAPTQDAAALGMSAAMAWWNMLQDQFTQAMSMAMTPVDGSHGEAPAGHAASTAGAGEGGRGIAGNRSKSASPTPDESGTAEPASRRAGTPKEGNGQARAARPKAGKA